MPDAMTDCPQRQDGGSTADAQRSPNSGPSVVDQLPMLQRNALRKIFDRPEFSPEEVAALGYRRLQQAEGIGNKGLAAIGAWLRQQGFDLSPPEIPDSPPKINKKTRRTIEQAARLLRTHGYIVYAGQAALSERRQR